MPFYPIYVIIQELILTEASTEYVVSVNSLEKARYHSAQFLQVDIGLESHLQLIITISLLLLAESQTNTVTGLEVLFENESLLYMNTKVALVLSISWSLFSCIKSQIKGISKKRQHSTTMSNALLLVFTFTCITLKVFSCIMYLTPAFGLFNILRHLQGELYPYWDPYKYPDDINDFNFYFGNAPPLNWTEITRWKYISYAKAEPPSITLYTYFTIEQYFGILLCIFALHLSLHLALKALTQPLVFGKLSWIDCLIHGISSCFIPLPMEEWDAQSGTVAMHKSRKDLVLKEMMASMLLNFSFHLLMLTPLVILGMYYVIQGFHFNHFHCRLQYSCQTRCSAEVNWSFSRRI